MRIERLPENDLRNLERGEKRSFNERKKKKRKERRTKEERPRDKIYPSVPLYRDSHEISHTSSMGIVRRAKGRRVKKRKKKKKEKIVRLIP